MTNGWESAKKRERLSRGDDRVFSARCKRWSERKNKEGNCQHWQRREETRNLRHCVQTLLISYSSENPL